MSKIRLFLSTAISIAAFSCPHSATAIEIESFTRPYRIVNIPAGEMGVLEEVMVREGDTVKKGQILARMDSRLLLASRAIAEASLTATSARQVAQAEKTLTEQQLKGYRELRAAGNATSREVDRAEANYWQAVNRLIAVDEEQQVRELEYQRILAQIDQRIVRSTIDGVVISTEKESGEFVSPTDPVIMRIVELERLKAVFSVPISQIDRWRVNQSVEVFVGQKSQPVTAVIEIISPVADAESGSVRLTVAIDNANRSIRSGVVCRWDLDAAVRGMRTTQASTQSADISSKNWR